MNFEFEGLDELEDVLSKLGEVGQEIENKALQAGGELLKKEFQNNIYKRIDRDTGNAARSITTSKIKNHQIHVGPTQDAFYLRFLEFGFFHKNAKRFIPATPIFQPIFLQSRQKIENAIMEAARSELEKL